MTGEVPLINTTNSEVGVNFRAQRIQNLPLAPNSNILNAALSVPGASFSANGMRTRSNNFVADGAGSNSPSVGCLLHEINNPDSVGEFRMITIQFAAEYGRAAGSVVPTDSATKRPATLSIS